MGSDKIINSYNCDTSALSQWLTLNCNAETDRLHMQTAKIKIIKFVCWEIFPNRSGFGNFNKLAWAN